MCMIASPDCSLTPRRGRKCPSPFQEETDLDITNTLGDDFDFVDQIEKDLSNMEFHDLLDEFHIPNHDYSKVKKTKPFTRKDTSSCIIAPPDCRLTPRKLTKCPSLFTPENDHLDNIFSDVDPESDEETKKTLDNNNLGDNKLPIKFNNIEHIIMENNNLDNDQPAVEEKIIENGIDNNNMSQKKIEIEEKSMTIADKNKKKPCIETDIRVKNYVQSLTPITVIRQRFRVERREEDAEDFLNYV